MDLQINGLLYGRWNLKPKPLGKVRRRLQEIKNPSVAPVTGDIDLSHNESIRLATDALLDQGLDAYQEVLAGDAEVDFLSLEEKGYILANAIDLSGGGLWETEKDDDRADSSHTAASQAKTETYCSAMSESEPPVLDHGWPVQEWSYHLQGRPGVQVYFQCDRAAQMKDLVRELIQKATTVLAIVMDTFSDLEIFCDILEATMKRNVSVYLLLDHVDLQLFVKMCETLQISNNQLTRMSVRCVQGVMYCAKSGKKFPGQIKEKFMIVDCSEVLAGSYSFTWLSWLVHRNMAVLFKGSAVKPFDLEFRKLYAGSKPVPAFSTAATPFGVHRPFIQTLHMFTSCPGGEAAPCTAQADPGSPALQSQHYTSLPTPTAQPSYSSLHPTEVKAKSRFNTQLINPNFSGQVTTTAQLRHPNSQPTRPSNPQGSVNQLVSSGLPGHRFDWITRRHVANRPLVLQRSFMGWRSFDGNKTLNKGMSSGLVDRHPVLKTGQWFSQQLKWHHVPK